MIGGDGPQDVFWWGSVNAQVSAAVVSANGECA